MAKQKIKTVKRFLWADLIRIVAIYLVVQIHTPTAMYNLFPWSIVTKIAPVAVPVFVILSGALLLDKQEDYKTFFRKRCIKVLIPWIVWTIIYMVYYYFLSQPQTVKAQFFSGSSPIIIQWLHYFYRSFLSNLWFLPLIFNLYLITPLIRILVNNAKRYDLVYLLFFWFISMSFLPFIFHNALFPQWEASMVFTLVQYLGYFIFGYFLIKNKFFKYIRLNSILLVSAIGVGYFYSNFLNGYLAPGIVIASLALFSLLVIFSDKIDKTIQPFLRTVIQKVSGATLGVYIIHKIVADLLANPLIKILSPFYLEFLLTLIIFAISTLIVLLFQKIPVVKHSVP